MILGQDSSTHTSPLKTLRQSISSVLYWEILTNSHWQLMNGPF